MYSEWTEFGGGNDIGAILPNTNLTRRTRDMLKMNNLGRLKELSSHYNQMANKVQQPNVTKILNQLAYALSAYANTQAAESRSTILDILGRIDKTRESGNINDLGVGGNVQMSARNSNPRANWQMRKGQRAVGESWSMNLDEE